MKYAEELNEIRGALVDILPTAAKLIIYQPAGAVETAVLMSTLGKRTVVRPAIGVASVG